MGEPFTFKELAASSGFTVITTVTTASFSNTTTTTNTPIKTMEKSVDIKFNLVPTRFGLSIEMVDLTYILPKG